MERAIGGGVYCGGVGCKVEKNILKEWYSPSFNKIHTSYQTLDSTIFALLLWACSWARRVRYCRCAYLRVN
jgi:hypothetical protein